MSKLNLTPAILVFAAIASFTTPEAKAQKGGPGVEQWKSFLPYSEVNGVVTDGTTFFCSTTSGFFTYNREDGSLTSYSKVNGMGDIGMTGVAYDKTTGYAILAYANSNVDLFKDNTFYSQPDLKITQISGDKTIHNIAASDGLAYLSTGIGLIMINLAKNETKDRVTFSQNGLEAPVYASLTDNTFLYAATQIGLYRIEKNSPFILNDDAWKKLSDKAFRTLGIGGGAIYTAVADSLYRVAGDGTVSFVEKIGYADTLPSIITSLDDGGSGLWVSVSEPDKKRGFGILRRSDGSRADSFATISPSQVVQLANGEVWFGDDSGYPFPDKHGLRKKTAADRSEPYFPDGPVTNSSFDVSAYNGEFWVAHGGKTGIWGVTYNRAMFSHFQDEKWQNYFYVSSNPYVQDFIRILKDWNGDHLYAASFSGGLYEMSPSGVTVYNQGYLDNYPSNPNNYFVTGLALDQDQNLWMTNYGSPNHELVVKTRDGRWINGLSIDGNTGHTAADVIVDDYGQKWFIAVGNGGAVVYNDNGTLENTSDDRYRIFKAGKGSGNLPDNNTLSIAKDKDGAIWIGTANGIGIINCGEQALDPSCQGELRIIQNDQFAGYLFEGQSVKALAVDGANRKWVGTSNGVWLLSDDASSTVYRFTEANSPLPSNNIERINLDPVTGDVYISTDKGLVSFRSTATEGKKENDAKLFIYPNPVPSDYNGMVAVRGIAENADVRFTDISGQLVYRTKALGGQAVWNCKDYTGRKVQSGVYLVFTVNKDGTQKATGKFMLLQ